MYGVNGLSLPEHATRKISTFRCQMYYPFESQKTLNIAQ
jgi:hypothetical protein